VHVRPAPSASTDLLIETLSGGPRRRQGRSSGRELHLDPGCGPPGKVSYEKVSEREKELRGA
jgi:hypothetical protein